MTTDKETFGVETTHYKTFVLHTVQRCDKRSTNSTAFLMTDNMSGLPFVFRVPRFVEQLASWEEPDGVNAAEV